MFKKHFLLSFCLLATANACVADTNVSKDLSKNLIKKDRGNKNLVTAPLSPNALNNDNGVAVQHFFIKSQLQARSGRFFISPMISYSLKPDAAKVETVWVGPAINYEF